MKKSEILIIGLVILTFAIGIYSYPRMPEKMASHWNTQGQADGYTSKIWGLFLMPTAILVLASFFILIPKIDPLKENIETFRSYYDTFILLVILFLVYFYLLTLLWNTGKRFNIVQMLAPAFSILIYYSGSLTEKAKPNWFIGIKTPWTLSSYRVWDKTNKKGGKLLKIAGIITFFGLFSKKYAIHLIIIPVITVAAYSVVYSYREYQKDGR